MTMEHKAYAFNWTRFATDMHSLLTGALADNDPTTLIAYVDHHLAELTDPYEGVPLFGDWRDALENRDIQEYADYALTRFYDATDCYGVGDAWTTLSDELPEAATNAMLGFPIGRSENLFDPGRCGSYFQTPQLVRESLTALRPYDRPELVAYLGLLQRCAAKEDGVYVTF